MVLDFFYDANGMPYALKHNGTVYYYITNLQGDVMQLVNANGSIVASYDYDPYGKVISATGTMAEINPLRYRGYYYDVESGLYYLQSRYYDPEIGRFINADVFASTNRGVLGYNMFAYCGNNPVIRIDKKGAVFFTILGTLVGAAVGALDAYLAGEDTEGIVKNAKAGAASGAIAGAGVDAGVLIVASGGTVGLALGVAAGTGALGGVVGKGISTDWTADPLDYAASALVGGGLNMISLGTAPINGEILKGTLSQMIDNVFVVCAHEVGSLIENTFIGTMIAEATALITRAVTRD